MDVDGALELLRTHHRAVLHTFRADGSPQMSPIVCALEEGGTIGVSTRETAMKVHNLRRDPRASLCVLGDGFFGEWCQVDGTAEIVALPDAMDPLIEMYRTIAGEHPDWADFRAAMVRERRVVVRVTPERAGPNRSG
jgi:PPOX class probable F420-dependent enzyme